MAETVLDPVVVCMLGRLGDLISMEPAFRRLRELHPGRRIVWYTKAQFAALYAKAPFFDGIVTVADKEDYLSKKSGFSPATLVYEFNFNKKKSPEPTRPDRPPTLLRQFTGGTDIEVSDAEGPRFYLDEAAACPELPDKYVVFHCSSNGRSRQWPLSSWNQLARLCFDGGFSVVEIGIHSVLTLNDTRVIHCNGELNLHTAAKIMRGARLFVGIESGFGHMANALGVFGVIITGCLRSFPEYNLYTGGFSPAGHGCDLVRFYGEYPDRMPYKTVAGVLSLALDGKPMSYDECTLYCLREQLAELHGRWYVRFFELLGAPFRRLIRVITVHRRKNS